MTEKRTQFDISVKTIPDGQLYRSKASLQRQSSFNGTDDPAADPIRSSPPTAPEQPSEQETTSDNEEANTTFVAPQPTINLDPDVDEKPVPTKSQYHIAALPVQEDLPGPTQAAQFGSLLAQLEIQWHKTCSDLEIVSQKASDPSLPQDLLEWYRKQCAYLQGRERSLREDIRRLTPLPPPPMDPHVRAYHEAVVAYREVLKEYWSQKPHH